MLSEGHSRPTLVGFLANDDSAAVMYAKMTSRACEANGIIFELRRVERVELEASVIAANKDPAVHGIIVYYPIFGGQVDDYLRDVISIEKDVEGLNHRYRYALYHNMRTLGAVSGQGGVKKCVLPCTPLAVVKILEATGAYDKGKPVGEQLKDRTVVVCAVARLGRLLHAPHPPLPDPLPPAAAPLALPRARRLPPSATDLLGTSCRAGAATTGARLWVGLSLPCSPTTARASTRST